MLSALQRSSMPSTSDSDTVDTASQTTAPNSALQHTHSSSDHLQGPLIHGNEPDSTAIETPLSQKEDHDMDYVDVPVHPLTTEPMPLPYSSPSSQSLSSQPPLLQFATDFPQQHQQLVRLKSERGYPPPSSLLLPPQQTLNTPDIIMTDESAKVVLMGSEILSSPTADRSMQEGNHDEDGDQDQTSELASHLERSPSPLVVDTSNAMIPTSRPSAATGTSPLTTSTPTTASLTPDSGSAAPSPRRSSLRTMTATLPRSPLQEETIALFKQYRALIPCAKCFSRNTIQRDGMSGNVSTGSFFNLLGCLLAIEMTF